MACDHKKALDLAKEGKWDQSHELVQSYSDTLSCLIHGYLHRVEGDSENARYWYERAGTVVPDNSLEEELNRLRQMIAG